MTLGGYGRSLDGFDEDLGFRVGGCRVFKGLGFRVYRAWDIGLRVGGFRV